jgi:hypothetical protein
MTLQAIYPRLAIKIFEDFVNLILFEEFVSFLLDNDVAVLRTR